MSLYHYFKPIQKVPNPNRSLLSVVPPSAINQENQEVMSLIDTFVPCVHIFYLFYLKRMLVSAAAHALANRPLNKASSGKVIFFVDRLYAIFFLQK